MRPKLYFCFPYRGVGGVSLLFLRLAEYLAAKNRAECYLVDYRNGFMARNRDPALTQLLQYEDHGDVPIPAGAIAIFQAMTPWSLFPALQLAADARVFFWNCHPFNLVPTLPGFRRAMQHDPELGSFIVATVLRSYRAIVRRFVRLLLQRQALVFMDRTNVTTTERYLRISIPQPEMLAIPAPAAPDVPRPGPDSSRLRLTWVGRLVDFKYYPLKYALRQLDALQADLVLPITFDVIGAGDHEQQLRDDVRELRNIRVRFCGELSPLALERHLAQETDVLLAMGTSALEGARLGVPTLLLDLSYGEVPNGYEFSWLYERDGYSLAEVAQPGRGGNRESLIGRLREVIERPKEISQATRAYFRRNHEIDTIGVRLLTLARQSNCGYGELSASGVLDKGIIYRAFCAMRAGFKSQ